MLHATVLYMLGIAQNTGSNSSSSNNSSDPSALYKHVLPALLRLACDVDMVPKQLFTPLVMQLIHWFTKMAPEKRPEPALMLDAILAGLSDSRNSALRDFCAGCVREFFVWSFKHTSDKKLRESRGGLIKVLLKRVMSMATHPNTFQRMGAALAINNIYARLRESELLVNMFVLELLDAFMRSLQLARRDDPAMGTAAHTQRALKNLRRIILKKVAW